MQQPLLPVDPLSTQVALNIVFSYLIERLKQSNLVPWFNSRWPRWAQRGVAIAVSGLTVVGVHFTTSHAGAGTYVITVTGLSMASVISSGMAWLKSFVFQEIAYQKLIKADAQPAVKG